MKYQYNGGISVDFDFGRYLKINVLNIHNSYLLNIYNYFNLSNKYATYKPLKVTIEKKLILQNLKLYMIKYFSDI